MAIYAIGDVQGCHSALLQLIETIAFDPDRDQLWFAGDIVNRGPESLATLRFIQSLQNSAITVLGNHDLTLLAVAEGYVKQRRKDTFDAILSAPDRDSLLTWLRHRPLLHFDTGLNFLLVHAGLPPQWDLPQALNCAAELEQVLRGPDYRLFLAQMFGQKPERWHDELTGFDRLRCITNILTRIRFCTEDGTLSLTQKGPPGSQPPPLIPWFEVSDRKNTTVNIVFGHWATLGYYTAPGIYALDSACVWGGQLTALRLDRHPPRSYHIDCGSQRCSRAER